MMKTHTRTSIPTTSCIAALLALASGNLSAVEVTSNLGGLLTPTGAPTNTNKDRQYAWTIPGGAVTLTYTLSTSNGDLSNTFSGDSLFRYAPSTNVNSGQTFTITIDSIVANPGWILNSVSMDDKVTVAIEGTKTARFSINGGATFDYVGSGVSGAAAQQVFTDSRFQDFNGPGDSLLFRNVNQTLNNGMNLRNLAMTFDISVASAPTILTVSRSGGNLDFTWNSASGTQYDLLSSTDLSTSPATWSVYNDGVNTYQNIPFSGSGTNTLTGVLPMGTSRFFVLRSEPLAP